MLVKKGVRLLGIKPELMMGLMVCDQIYTTAGHVMTVTSIVDSKHSPTSRHYIGMAADIRTRGLHNAVKMLKMLKDALPEFYIELEAYGTPNEHIHIQFNGTYPE